MKNILLLIFCGILLMSCQITEKVYFSEDGSVKVERQIDVSEMMSQIISEKEIDSLRNKEHFPLDTIIPASELSNIRKEDFDENRPGYEKLMKALDNAQLHIVLSENEFKITSIISGENTDDFNQKSQGIVNALEEYEKNKGEDESTGIYSSVGLDYLQLEYDGKNFKRIGNVPLDEENDEESEIKELKGVSEFMNYKMEYHFPKPIKETSAENATFSKDGKTMYVDVNVQELFKTPEKYNFSVELE